jgi:hypothetical protein
VDNRATSHRRNARTIEHDWIQAMSRMINALFSTSPRSAYEILSIRFNGKGRAVDSPPSLPVVVFERWQGLEAGSSPSEGRGESALRVRRAGIGALVASISLGLGSNVLFLAAFQFRFDRLSSRRSSLLRAPLRPSCCVGRRF